MLKFCILFSMLACINAAVITQKYILPREETDFVPIVRSIDEHKDDGSFHFAYEAADGSLRKEAGTIENPGTEDETLEVSGSYRYIDADGHDVEVRYTAGKNGFVPEGNIIPKEITDAAKAESEYARNIRLTDA